MPKITRRRTILACKRCFGSKRKCGKEKPTCKRCKRARVKCEYFTEEQLEKRIEERRSTVDADDIGAPSKQSVPDTELDPSTTGEHERRNFKLIVNETGEYSKYFPLALFPYCDHANNVSFVVNRLPNQHDSKVTFNFGKLVKPLSTVQEVRSRFPMREVGDSLVDHYFKCIHPLVPIIDKEEFFLKYNQYWEHPSKYRDLNGMLLMFAVFFCSSQSMELNEIYREDQNLNPEVDAVGSDSLDGVEEHDVDNSPSSSSSSSQSDYHRMKVKFHQCIENLKAMLGTKAAPSVSSLTSTTLSYYVGTLNCDNILGELASLIKYAQVVGLHRNISHGSLRDMLYSYIWYLDTLSAYYSGMAPTAHPDYYEIEANFPLPTDDLPTLFSLVRFYSGSVSADVLSEVNKIAVSNSNPVARITNKFSGCVRIVNELNDKIMSTPGYDTKYLRWLTVEGRLGLWKAALLLSVLRASVDVANRVPEAMQTFGKDLVLYSMLLMNESICKVNLGLEVLPDSMWFIRCSYPFQAMSIVLLHIQRDPTPLNFSTLAPELEFTVIEGLDYYNGDLRLQLIEASETAMSKIRATWPVFMQGRCDKVMEAKNRILSSRAAPSPYMRGQQPLDALENSPSFLFDTPPPTEEEENDFDVFNLLNAFNSQKGFAQFN